MKDLSPPRKSRFVGQVRGLRIVHPKRIGMLGFWCIAAFWAALGWALNEPAIIALASAVVGTSWVILDLRRSEGFGAATIWGASMALTGIADGVGMLVTNPVLRDYFFLYAVDEYLADAQAIMFLGGSAILLGFAVAEGSGFVRHLLPPIARGPAAKTLWAWAFVVGVVVLLMRIRFIQIGSGTFLAVFNMAVPMVVFVLAREASRRSSGTLLWAAASLAYAEATRAVFFEFLRGLMLLPLVALLLGCLIGARSLRSLRQLQILPAYAGLAIFIVFFGAFGADRSNLGYGMGRVQEIAQGDVADSGPLSLLARLTSFNQVSQVVRLAKEEGFEYGQTLTYFGYVFIPRFLWSDKPMIAQGRWFAERIGLGTWRTEGGFSNSINMTIAGEWYLNFGWIGPVLGGFLAGLWIGVSWNAARFWSSAADPVTGAFAFLMLYFAWNMNVDTQALPTVLALYMIFLCFSQVLHLTVGARRGSSRLRAERQRRVSFSELASPRSGVS